MKVRVRFAPSPTGYLHIGGARTALFNYLFAKHNQGKFLLRVEDTDTIRSSTEMTEAIFRSLHWLGLEWDEEPVYQSSRTEFYKTVCEELVKKERAYPCFCSADEVNERRKAGSITQQEYLYDRKCRDLSPADVKGKLARGIPSVIRFRVPEGETAFQDAVRGRVVFQNKEIDDFIILRSDRTPVYQVAVVTDDHDMGITHVIRGDDHLSNTPKQVMLYHAMDWTIPLFAHVPMILGSDKKRLSKRHGATSVEEYKRGGFLPQALLNYLALLGWSPGDDREMMDLREMIESFSLNAISKNAAVFDEKKLEWMNSQYIHRMTNKDLLESVKQFLIDQGILEHKASDGENVYLLQVIGILKERTRRLGDFAEIGTYFFKDPETYDQQAVKKFWSQESTRDLFTVVINRIGDMFEWRTNIIEEVIRSLATDRGMSAGKIIHPIRLALTGREASPGLFDVMELLGKETVLRRLIKARNNLGNSYV